MKSEETYRKLLSKLKENEVVFEQKDDVKQRILQQISNGTDKKPYRIGTIYAWTEIKWLRWSVSTAAVLFITLFLTQQFTISKRLERLEEQFVKTDNTVVLPKASLATSQRVLLNMIPSKNLDSITVSKSDLEALLEEYLNLQAENKNLKNNSNPETIFEMKNDDPKTRL